MPSGIYTRTKETRKALSIAKIGCKYPHRKSPPPRSEETRRKIGVALKENKHALGIKHTKEWKEIARKRMLGNTWGFQKGAHVRENHWNWIKDRTKLAKRNERNDMMYKEWRRNVKNRDNWNCRIADDNCEGKVVAHHILSWAKFPELRYQVNNGITLCRFHHPRRRDDEMKLSPYFQELVMQMN